MSRKKQRGQGEQSENRGKSNVNAQSFGGTRRLLLAIVAIIAIAGAAVIWLDSGTSDISGAGHSASSQPASAALGDGRSRSSISGGPSIYFPESVFDFGTVGQRTKTSHTFVVQNIGDEPLKLIRAKGS